MEMIEHEVVVDDYITVKLKIPKVLTAMDLKGLMMKTNKLFNMSEVAIQQPSTRKKYVKFSDDIKDEIARLAYKENLKPKQIYGKLKDKCEISMKQISALVFNMRAKKLPLYIKHRG
jgi:hypothetical protein